MRISTSQIYRDAISQMQSQQLSLSKIQDQIASGVRLRTAKDDPAAASRILNIEQSLDNIDRMGENASLSLQRLGQLDSTLGELNDQVRRVRELAVQANSGTLTRDELGHINAEVRQLFNGILQLANRQDGEGHYVFAGNDQAATPPFAGSGNNVSYAGDQGTRQLEIAPGQYISGNLPGSEIFQRIPTGTGQYRVREAATNTGALILKHTQLTDPAQWDNGPYQVSFIDSSNYEVRDAGNALIGSGSYSPNGSIDVQGVRMTFEGTPAAGDRLTLEAPHRQDIFSTVEAFSEALSAPAGTANARLANSIYATLEDLDQAMASIDNQRALVGSRMNSAESALNTHDALSLQFKESLSSLKDLDYAEASAQLAQQLTALQAAQSVFVKVQGLSLFNYLG